MNPRWIVTVGIALTMASASAAAVQDAAKIAQGEKLYAAQKCSTCHSVADKGNKKGPLDGVGDKLSADEIRQWLVDPAAMSAKANSTRKPVMKPYTKLSKDELDALVAYVHSLKKK
jgi:mono/diheme cytochrome c family protein